MNILLTAINAKYIHSNLAVYSLKAYAKEFEEQIQLAEYTINHRTDYILQQLYKKKPDVVCFSCYIWNFRYVQELITELHKLMPHLPIWVGGPEVSYEPKAFLKDYPMVEGVMVGEGEETFLELCRYYVSRWKKPESTVSCLSEAVSLADSLEQEGKALEKIPGLVFRNSVGSIIRSPKRKVLDMDSLLFCYGHLENFQNRIIYYETSRGCPFSCSYCLSSIEKNLRFRSFSLVEQELQFFLDHEVPQVKFVDRTFNCNHKHAMEIWKYLKEHDNGITNFHFEISADLLTEEEIALIASMRPGLIQLEIGVQSTHEPTIREIHRTMNLSKLEKVVRKVQQAQNVHQHLDLIAGLPMEDFPTFAASFGQIYRLKPQQLQLGFLKVLKGSYLYENRADYGLVYQEYPPYEVMATNWLSYEDILKIKLAEEMLEVYYNSGQFELTMKVLELTEANPFFLFWKLGEFYEDGGLLSMSHSRIRRCEILLEYIEKTDGEHLEIYKQTLTFDLYYRENMKTRPVFAGELDTCRELIKQYCKNGRMSHAEPFCYDIGELLEQKSLTAYPKKLEKQQIYLFSYDKKDPLTRQALVSQIPIIKQHKEEL